MNQSRQTVIFSVAGVLLALCCAAHAATTAVLYRPNPQPPCGDYIDDCPKPKPWDNGGPDYDHRYHAMSGLGQQASGVSKAVASGNLDKAGEGLNSLFTGSGEKSSGSNGGAVYAGDYHQASSPMVLTGGMKGMPNAAFYAPRGLDEAVVPVPAMFSSDGRENGRGQAKLLRVGLEGEVGKAVVGKAVEVIIDKANEAAEKYVNRDQTKESVEKYGGCRMKGTC